MDHVPCRRRGNFIFCCSFQEWVEALSFYHFLVTGTVVTYSQVNYNSRLIGWLVSHLGRSAWISQAVYDKSQVKGELEWKVGKWAGVPVRPGIAHWERRERMEAKESEVEEKEKGGTQGEGKGEGHHEELEEGLGAVAISEGGEPQIQEGLKSESPAPQVNFSCTVLH